MTFELAWQREEWKVEDEITKDLRKALQLMIKNRKDTLKRVEKHRFLREFYSEGLLQEL